MEMHQLTCDNLGMTRDMSISSLSKGEDGSTNYAFENHNIRILAVNDNTKFSVTNEKSTAYETSIEGVFLGGCTCGRYLVVFMQVPRLMLNNRYKADFIYRLEYNGSNIVVTELYNGNLNFCAGTDENGVPHPIEAIGYYESEEVQKVYWVDGLNQNRFINIVKFSDDDTDPATIEKKYFFHVWLDLTDDAENNPTYESLYYKEDHKKELSDGTLHALCKKDGTVIGYTDSLAAGADVWLPNEVVGVTSIANLPAASHSIETRTLQYDDYSFDFQGRINYIPKVLKLEKNYSKAGSFQAGVLQYFFTYYNKYGVETCLVWNSDLQYISLSDRGGKADEAVSCGFDFEITNLEEKYDYLRIYSAYRSGLNGVVSSKIVADISLDNTSHDSVIKFTDLGAAGITFNYEDIPYIGGQDIRANTLDYKQDTLFLGDISIASNNVAGGTFPTRSVNITSVGGFEEPTEIREGYYNGKEFILWSYKYVSPVAKDNEGVYRYDSEITQSQEEVAGFKWRELYRFGIQFLDKEGTWTPAYWLGDKYCNLPPRVFTEEDTYLSIDPTTGDPQILTPWPISASFGDIIKEEYYTVLDGERVYDNEVVNFQNNPEALEKRVVRFHYVQDGCYIATAMVDIGTVLQAISASEDLSDLQKGFADNNYIAYRLLVVDTDITNRRIVEQGVVNPTMFNYADRYYNRPFSIPSWIFRPRMSAITHRHYATLPVQTENNAELQGIVEKQVPGFESSLNGMMNSYLFIVAADEASVWSGHIQWKLIYFNSGNTDTEKAEKLYLQLYTGVFPEGTSVQDREAEYAQVAEFLTHYQLPLKPNDNDNPGAGIIYPNYSYVVNPGEGDRTFADVIEELKGYLRNGYIPVYIYGNSYTIISSRIYDNSKASGTTLPRRWSSLRSHMVEDLTNDMRATTDDIVGEELAGKIILSQAMLPDSNDIKLIARTASVDAAEIGLAIMAALVAAAAVVLSALSFGTLAPAMAVATTAAVSFAASVCAAGAVGLAAGAAALAVDSSDMNEMTRRMLALGYMPIGNNYRLAARQKRSRSIGLLLDRFFKPDATKGSNGYINNGGIYTGWNVPVLVGDTDGFREEQGNVPFTTGHPYTEQGRIGEDYNAFSIGGILTSLDENEADLKKKQNLFCVDESIITLNAPDIEDISHVVNNNEGLRLDLIGVIPVEATYGMYSLTTESGLNSNSQVLQGRFNTNVIGDKTQSALGMLNGFIYQDFEAELAQFGPENASESQDDNEDSRPIIQVTEETAAYRVFMWNKDIAGFWFPGVTLKDPVAGEPILEAHSRITNKVFANMRYSRNSLFFPPKAFNIETPTSCLDAEAMLKTFNHNSDVKNYYEGVDTISVNDHVYPLVENFVGTGQNYPDTEARINVGNLKDPVHIRYKETPHILIPFSWNKDNNGANILPYIADSETPIQQLELYDKTLLGNIQLYGVVNDAPAIGNHYIYTQTTNSDTVTDEWAREGALNNSALGTLETLTAGGAEAYDAFDRNKEFESNSGWGYLLKSGVNAYYLISPNGEHAWKSAKITALPENTEVIVKTSTYYVTQHIATTSTEEALKGEASLSEGLTNILTENPHKGTWNQAPLSWRYMSDTPYLFMGELVKKSFDYATWNGGIDRQAMEQLTWNVASKVTPLEDYVNKSWGDTFYQRWDCEKTYPFTEEDVNSNVEILSFMVESHANLDGRCDVNRGTHNLLNVRPHNTIFNNVYSQKDNFFTYQVLDEKFSKSHFEADIVWSLTKNNMDDIDKWTCLLASNEMSLDGRYGTVRKVLNVNDVLITFQDTGIAQVRYNETAALNTTSGLPLQMGNTGKVDGYRMVSDTIGCHNKFSINKNSAGVFFADDFGKSFNQFTANTGIADIGMRANFSQWFKKNLNGHLWRPDTRDNFRVSYDEITHDLYIVRNDVCVIYNTLLQKFTSFMDYIDTPMIARLISNGGDSDTFAIRSTVNNARMSVIEIWKMFAGASTSTEYGAQGAYGYIYGEFRPYSMEYRLNPDPFHDSIFTNYQYAADWTDPSKEVDEDNLFDTSARRYTTFDTVEAKNEFQQGIMAIQQSGNIAGNTVGLRRVFGRQPVKSMFRLWRGDIPRHGDTLTGHTPMSDRLRNPWIHLKFEKSAADDSKMTFHNLMVNYYNQYGRF